MRCKRLSITGLSEEYHGKDATINQHQMKISHKGNHFRLHNFQIEHFAKHSVSLQYIELHCNASRNDCVDRQVIGLKVQ